MALCPLHAAIGTGHSILHQVRLRVKERARKVKWSINIRPAAPGAVKTQLEGGF